VPDRPLPSAKNDEGETDEFQSFVRRLVAVPSTEIKAKIAAEKKNKGPASQPTSSSGRASTA
jgi:hypothetical protein